MDLGEVNGDQDDVSHYAFTLVHSERQQEGYLAFGYGDVLTGDADGGDVAKVWLNGEVVYENHERHGFMLADTTFPRIHARLNRGDNRLLFKIGNVSRDAWMAAHVVDEDGYRLFDIEYVLPSRRWTRKQQARDPKGWRCCRTTPIPSIQARQSVSRYPSLDLCGSRSSTPPDNGCAHWRRGSMSQEFTSTAGMDVTGRVSASPAAPTSPFFEWAMPRNHG